MTTTLTPAEITTAFRALQTSNPTAALTLIEALIKSGWDDAPAMWTDSHPDPDDEDTTIEHLVCPHCKQWPEEVTAVDYGIRETETYVEDDAFDNEALYFPFEQGDFHGMTYKAACCGGVVSLPEGWRES